MDAVAQDSFYNFESGHTRPLAISPSGDRLFALNTPDGRLAIFDIDSMGITMVGEVLVGLEPVSVAVRENTTSGRTEAWVVNLLSDSVSVVEIDDSTPSLSRVIRSLHVGDEPRDIVFAGPGQSRAFVTSARRGQNLPPELAPRFQEKSVPRALLWVFDADSPGAGIGGTPITVLELFADSPRALATSADGSVVYAAIFHSGNGTTALDVNVVANNGGRPPLPPDSPYAGAGNPNPPPDQGLIVRFDPATGEWNDELGRDWAAQVKFSLPDLDVFAIDATSNPPAPAGGIATYPGVGTVLFNMAVRPGSGAVYVTNTEALNHVRFEPIEAGGIQGHVVENRITVLSGISVTPIHVNPHIDYSVATGPASETDESLAILTEMVFSSNGDTLYVAALGSNQIAAFDASALESGSVTRDLIDVGGGPSGIALDENFDRLYVLNSFDHTISIVTDVSDPALRAQTSVVSLGSNPTDPVVRAGRSFLYDARGTSGHGDSACASCHVFGNMDSLAWELGDPYGELMPNPNPKVPNEIFAPPVLPPFHPVKGPMVTQSLLGLADAGPMHWRGDRTGGDDPGGDATSAPQAFKKFNAAFVDLLGRSAELTPAEMQAFTDFAMTMRYPPNPVRALDGHLTANEAIGLDVFLNAESTEPESPCVECHGLPLGTTRSSAVEGFDTFKVPHLRNLYQKVGMFGPDRRGNPPDPSFKGDQIRGFGYVHDGIVSTVLDFVEGFPVIATQAVEVTDFLLGFDTGLHPAVGQQLTLDATNVTDASALGRLELLEQRAMAGECDLLVSTVADGESRTGLHTGESGAVWFDRSSESLISLDALESLALQAGAEQTYTCAPPGAGKRMALDRDQDGVMNGDERDEGTDPGDATSVPLGCVGGAIEGINEAQLKIAKNQAPAGDERLKIKGEWVLPEGAGAIDPITDGINVLLRQSDGTMVWHRRLLPGAPNLAGDPGWQVAGSLQKWTYRAMPGVIGGGIVKVSVTMNDGRIKMVATGKGSDFRTTVADLTLEVVLGTGAEAANGLCATRTFAVSPGSAPFCSFGPGMKTLKCG